MNHGVKICKILELQTVFGICSRVGPKPPLGSLLLKSAKSKTVRLAPSACGLQAAHKLYCKVFIKISLKTVEIRNWQRADPSNS